MGILFRQQHFDQLATLTGTVIYLHLAIGSLPAPKMAQFGYGVCRNPLFATQKNLPEPWKVFARHSKRSEEKNLPGWVYGT